MTRKLPISLALLVCLSGGLLLGCGSQTKTISATNAPVPTQSATTSTTQSTTTSTSTTKTTSTPTQSTATSSTPTSTHSAPEPAFTQQEAHAEGVSAAAALVRAHGYTPNNTSEYHDTQTLRVLIGTRTGSGDGYGQQAFFFLAGRYLGTDTKEPSATLKVLSQSDTEVTLAYPLYRSSDPLSTPSGGQATVHFQLNNGKLVPLGHIPPASRSAGLSRY